MGEPDNFERRLAAALRARPELVASLSLADQAMHRARVIDDSEIRLARLVRIRRWSRIATVAALLLVGATITIGYLKFPASTAADATGDVAASATTIDFTTIGLTAFLIALVGVVLTALLAPERPPLRFTPA